MSLKSLYVNAYYLIAEQIGLNAKLYKSDFHFSFPLFISIILYYIIKYYRVNYILGVN